MPVLSVARNDFCKFFDLVATGSVVLGGSQDDWVVFCATFGR